jgi:hypothetical protein
MRGFAAQCREKEPRGESRASSLLPSYFLLRGAARLAPRYG